MDITELRDEHLRMRGPVPS